MAFFLTFKRSWTLNLIVWGMYLGIIYTPLYTIAGAEIITHSTQDGWAGIGFLMIFVPLEFIAILLFIIGCIGAIRKKINMKKMHNDNSIDIS